MQGMGGQKDQRRDALRFISCLSNPGPADEGTKGHIDQATLTNNLQRRKLTLWPVCCLEGRGQRTAWEGSRAPRLPYGRRVGTSGHIAARGMPGGLGRGQLSI